MSKKKKGESIADILVCLFVICLCITLILVILKLSLFPAIPWIATLIPVFIFLGIFLLAFICIFCSAIVVLSMTNKILFMTNKEIREKMEEIRRRNNK